MNKFKIIIFSSFVGALVVFGIVYMTAVNTIDLTKKDNSYANKPERQTGLTTFSATQAINQEGNTLTGFNNESTAWVGLTANEVGMLGLRFEGESLPPQSTIAKATLHMRSSTNSILSSVTFLIFGDKSEISTAFDSRNALTTRLLSEKFVFYSINEKWNNEAHISIDVTDIVSEVMHNSDSVNLLMKGIETKNSKRSIYGVNSNKKPTLDISYTY